MKSSVVPTAPSSQKSPLLSKSSSFSRKQLTAFALAFALIGGYLLFRTFAASPPVATLQAEQMVLPAGGSVITDSKASAGKAARLNSNGTTTGTVNFPAAVTSFIVTAKATTCSGSPNMTVSIDGSTYINAVTVSNTSWTAYSANANLASGSHSLSIQFSNDYSNRRHRCDRNLYLDVTNFYGPVSVPAAAPSITFSALPSTVTAGQASTLTWNSTNATACTAGGTWSGNQNTSGSVSTGALNQSSAYTLNCTGPGGSASANASVTVTQATASGGGTTYYVNPSGSDSNNGSQTAPWKTIAKACAGVPAGQNSIISVASGSYTETATCSLPCMVSLQGAGSTVVAVKGSADPLINVANCSASTNKQTVSGLKLDGQSRSAGTVGMSVNNVYGLTITDIDSENFKGTPAPTSGGGALNISNATNLDLGHSTFRNGGNIQSGQCTGTVGLGNIYNSKIHDLTISEDTGYGIKDSVIPSEIDNTDFNNLNVSIGTTDCSQWNTLAMELFETGAINDTIENSMFNGTVSLTDPGTGSPLSSGYRYDIHNNRWDIISGSLYAIELDQDTSHVHNNYFNGGLYPMANFTGDAKIGNIVDHNVFDNQQGPVACWHDPSGVTNSQFYNNTVILRQSIECLNFASSSTINIHDNIFYSTSNIGDKLGGVLGSATINNDSFFNLTAKGTSAITANPQLPLSGGFPAAYTPPAGSPAVGLGAFVGGSFTVGPN